MAEEGIKETPLKRRIRDRDTIIGLVVPLWLKRDRIEPLLERNSYDFLWVDSQHAALNEETLVSFCEMAGALGIDVQFRIKDTRHAYLIGSYLDLGPSGVEVPQVELESTVDEAVSSFYYPPTGTRSMGGSTRLGLEERRDLKEYAQWWKDYGVLWVQIESVEAVTNAQKLAKPGVDCLSIGPADLTFSIESNPDSPFKTVDDCVRHMVEQLKDTDVAVCCRPSSRDGIRKYADMGARVLLERWDF